MLTEDRFAPGDYYARLVRVDGSVGGDAELYLDAIEHQHARRWVQSRDRDDFIAQAPHPGVVVHAAGQQGDLNCIPGDRPDGLAVGDWFKLTLGSSGYPADFAYNDNLAVDPSHTYIKLLVPVSGQEAQALAHLHEVEGNSPSSHAPTLKAGAPDYWVACMNMGQGSCVAVMSKSGRPAAYVDVGFPTMPYARTAPENAVFKAADPAGFAMGGLKTQRDPRACVCDEPLLVFTHWDWDHWYQGELMRKRFGAFNLDVLAPVMPTRGTTAVNFWKHVPAIHRFVLSSPSPPASPIKCVAFDWGFLVRCTGVSKNQSGVAAYVRVRAASATLFGYPRTGTVVASPTFMVDERYVLIPGDADYSNLPHTGSVNLVGLVATHHGADAVSAPHIPTLIPSPEPSYSDPRIVYSYGLRDAATGGQTYCYRVRRPRHGGAGHADYGHPRPAAVVAHDAAGWTRRLDTAAAVAPIAPAPVNRGHAFIADPPAHVRSTACATVAPCTGDTTMVRCVS